MYVIAATHLSEVFCSAYLVLSPFVSFQTIVLVINRNHSRKAIKFRESLFANELDLVWNCM